MFRSAQHDNKRVPRQANQSLITDHQPRLLLGAHMSIRCGVSMAIDRVLAGLPKIKTRIALETTAGQGSCLGYKFEQLAYIISRVREPERVCVCLDTRTFSPPVTTSGMNLRCERPLANSIG